MGVGPALGGSEPPSRGKLVGAGQEEEEEQEEAFQLLEYQI